MKLTSRLSSKVFLYSFLISIIVSTIIITYFIFLLPGIYARDKRAQNLENIVATQKSLLKDFKKKIDFPYSYYAVKLEKSSKRVALRSNFVPMSEITVNDSEIAKVVNDLTATLRRTDAGVIDLNKIDYKPLKKLIPSELTFLNKGSNKMEEHFKQNPQVKIHEQDGIYIGEYFTASNAEQYVNYLSITTTDNGVIVGMYPMMISKFSDLSQSIVSILPAIILLLSVVIILGSKVFSKQLVNPIQRLVSYSRKLSGNYENFEPIEINDNLELQTLSDVLNELHENLVASLEEVSMQNREIMDAKKRQDVFLIASSHQLKTPLAAALLVVDGMINNVGKYQDYQKFLPVTKKELIDMNNIIYEMIELNSINLKEIILEEASITEIVNACLSEHQTLIKEKELFVKVNVNNVKKQTNTHMLFKMIDNLISNAIKYSPGANDIEIICTTAKLEIINKGCAIEEDVLTNIFDPFVRSQNTRESGHGLGLYIVENYALNLGYQVVLENIEDGVKATLLF